VELSSFFAFVADSLSGIFGDQLLNVRCADAVLLECLLALPWPSNTSGIFAESGKYLINPGKWLKLVCIPSSGNAHWRSRN